MLVLGVLEVVLLEVSPQELDAFGAASLLLADDVSEVGAELHGFGESSSLRHDEDLSFGVGQEKRKDATVAIELRW